MDLNPVFATQEGAIAADVRIVVDFDQKPPRYRPAEKPTSSTSMNRIMQPKAVAVIGASDEAGKIGNSVMKNLINGGYKGKIYPIHPKAAEIMGHKAYKSVKDVPGEIDTAVFAIPAKFVAGALDRVRREEDRRRRADPLGLRRDRQHRGPGRTAVEIGRKYNIRLMGPNIYGFYYTPANLCATFCTAYDVKGSTALSSQSGGIGMAIIGFSRSAKMGVSAIVGLGNKSRHRRGRPAALLRAGRQHQGDRAALRGPEGRPRLRRSRQARLEEEAGDHAQGRPHRRPAPRRPARTPARSPATTRSTRTCCAQSGVIRARSLRDLLDFARGVPILPTPKGENVRHHHRRRRLGRAAVRRLRRQRPEAAQADARRPRRRVPQVHPAVRRGRQPGRHHRRRAAASPT